MSADIEILRDASGSDAGIRGLGWNRVHPEKITFFRSLTSMVLTEEEPVPGMAPPPFKFVYHRFRTRSGYDPGAGILRVCAWMNLVKNYAVKDRVGVGRGLPDTDAGGQIRTGASKADREALIRAVRSPGSDAAGVISKSTEIEFIEARKGSSLNVYESPASFCDARMSNAMLRHTLTFEQGAARRQGPPPPVEFILR